MSQEQEIRALRKALMPFARVAAIMPDAKASWPDDKPNEEFIPAVWPDWGDFRRALEAVGRIENIG